jgi:Uma2 family endonuclease
MPTIEEHRGPWRFDEVAALPDDGRRYEVVDGVLVVTPPPTQRHQLIGSVLLHQLAPACPPG